MPVLPWNAMKQWAKYVLQTWGNNQLFSGIILFVLGIIFASFLPALWRLLTRCVSWLWAGLQGRGTDHAFERKYLDWLIDHHRHLTLIPAQAVTRRWGERQQLVDLEKVYIRLSVSTHQGDENWSETTSSANDSWRKRPGFAIRLLLWIIGLVAFFRPEKHPGHVL